MYREPALQVVPEEFPFTLGLMRMSFRWIWITLALMIGESDALKCLTCGNGPCEVKTCTPPHPDIEMACMDFERGNHISELPMAGCFQKVLANTLTGGDGACIKDVDEDKVKNFAKRNQVPMFTKKKEIPPNTWLNGGEKLEALPADQYSAKAVQMYSETYPKLKEEHQKVIQLMVSNHLVTDEEMKIILNWVKNATDVDSLYGWGWTIQYQNKDFRPTDFNKVCSCNKDECNDTTKNAGILKLQSFPGFVFGSVIGVFITRRICGF